MSQTVNQKFIILIYLKIFYLSMLRSVFLKMGLNLHKNRTIKPKWDNTIG